MCEDRHGSFGSIPELPWRSCHFWCFPTVNYQEHLIMNYSMFHILLFFHDVPLWTKQGSVKGSRNASIKQHMPQLLILNFLVHLFCWLPIQEDITRWLHNLFPSTTLYKWIIFNLYFTILVLYLIQILNFPHPIV